MRERPDPKTVLIKTVQIKTVLIKTVQIKTVQIKTVQIKTVQIKTVPNTASTTAPTFSDRLFPRFDPSWIRHEDESLVVVDKPAGMPSQAADETRGDDLVTRLALFLAEREGRTAPAYLGVHQRLDGETSGLVVFAKDPSVNAALSEAFEGRRVDKVYVACVRGWRGPSERTLRSFLSPMRDGVVVVHDRPVHGAKEALTRVRVLESRGDVALVRCTLETGRTHQIRAQLAHEGAPVLGDPLYGGAAAPRLMLHAEHLSFPHPRGGLLKVVSPAPASFSWCVENGVGNGVENGARKSWLDAPAVLDEVFARASQRRFAIGWDPKTTHAFRLVHEIADGAPGVAVDVYGDWAVLHVFSEEGLVQEGGIADALVRAGAKGVYIKRRPKQANTLSAKDAEYVAPSLPIRGESAPREFPVFEYETPYSVRLGDGLSTGLFLDQRNNRRFVREHAEGKRVLNLFAYTCGFTVAAAAGRAARTVSVDASAASLARGEDAVRRMDPQGDHTFIRMDAFEWLKSAARRGERFDLIIVDPPTYSTTKKSRWTSGNGWRELAAAVLRVAEHGAIALMCTNDRRMDPARFRRLLREGAALSGRALASCRDVKLPRDFPTWRDEPAHALFVRLDLA